MAARKYDIGRARSGSHKKPRRLVTQSEEAFELQEKAAALDGFDNWNAWLTDLADKRAKRVLAKSRREATES